MILTGITIESCSLIAAGPSISGHFPVLVSEAPHLSSTLMALSYQQLACCWSKNDASWRSQDAQWWVLSSPSLSGSRFISVPVPHEVSSPPRHLLHQQSFSLSLWFSLSLSHLSQKNLMQNIAIFKDAKSVNRWMSNENMVYHSTHEKTNYWYMPQCAWTSKTLY